MLHIGFCLAYTFEELTLIQLGHLVILEPFSCLYVIQEMHFFFKFLLVINHIKRPTYLSNSSKFSDVASLQLPDSALPWTVVLINDMSNRKR